MTEPLELNDETLSAYLDGELDEAQRKQVDALLATDPGASLRLARMRRADALLRAAFPLPEDGAADPLAARILGSAVTQPPAAGRAWYRRATSLTAMAAGLGALAVGSVLLLGRGAGSQADAALQVALDQLPSGSERLDGDRRTRPLLSFRADDGRWCRVYARQSAGAGEEGLACRNDRGWQVLAQDAGSADGSLRPAGSSAAIDTLMQQLGDAPALEADAERQLIDQGWQGSRR
jgi:hypothetical protein